MKDQSLLISLTNHIFVIIKIISIYIMRVTWVNFQVYFLPFFKTISNKVNFISEKKTHKTDVKFVCKRSHTHYSITIRTKQYFLSAKKTLENVSQKRYYHFTFTSATFRFFCIFFIPTFERTKYLSCSLNHFNSLMFFANKKNYKHLSHNRGTKERNHKNVKQFSL